MDAPHMGAQRCMFRSRGAGRPDSPCAPWRRLAARCSGPSAGRDAGDRDPWPLGAKHLGNREPSRSSRAASRSLESFRERGSRCQGALRRRHPRQHA
jgi:hypothetical protein